MKIRKLITLSSILASMGIVFGATSNIDARPVKADGVVETKLCFYEGDEHIMKYNLEKSEYYIEHIYILDSAPFVITQGNVTYGMADVDNSSTDLFHEVEVENYINVIVSDYYSIYFTSNKEIHGTISNPEVEASNWAKTFLDDGGIACDPNYIDPPNNWDFFYSSFQNSLSNEAKNIFVEADARNDAYASEIEQCAYIHDLCVAKYSLSVFMYSNEGTRSPAYNPNISNVINFNSTALIITIVSVVTFTSLLALVIFKKNKSR